MSGISGQFILTGSQSLNMLEKVTQSLAGRTAVLKLLPLSMDEVRQFNDLPEELNVFELIFNGFYPGKYNLDIHPTDFFLSCFETYIQRDVRQIKNISNLELFSNKSEEHTSELQSH